MAEEPINHLGNKQISTASQSSTKSTKVTATVLSQTTRRVGMVSHFLSVVGMGVAALLVGSSSGLVKLLENKTQTFFYLLRGPIPSPKDIVILAIDEASISRSQQYYQAD